MTFDDLLAPQVRERAVRLFHDLPKIVNSPKFIHLTRAIGTEEAVAVAGLAIAECIRGYTPNSRSKFTTYTYTAIRNALAKAAKKRVAAGSPADLDADGIPADDVDHDIGLDAAECLRRASVQDRSLLIRRYIRGESVEKIARSSGVHKDRIKERLDNAVQRVRVRVMG